MTDDEATAAANDFLQESLVSFEQRAKAIEDLCASLRRDLSVFRRMHAGPAQRPTPDSGPNYMGKDGT